MKNSFNAWTNKHSQEFIEVNNRFEHFNSLYKEKLEKIEIFLKNFPDKGIFQIFNAYKQDKLVMESVLTFITRFTFKA